MYTKNLTEYVFNDEIKKVKINGYVVLDDICKEVFQEYLEVNASYYKDITDELYNIEDEIKNQIMLEPVNYEIIIKEVLNKYLSNIKIKLKKLYDKSNNKVKRYIIERLLELDDKNIEIFLHNILNHYITDEERYALEIDNEYNTLSFFENYKDEINEYFSNFLNKNQICLEDLTWFDTNDYLFLSENNQINVVIFVLENIIIDIADEINFEGK